MKKLKVFISYAHEDKEYKDELDKFLVMCKRNESIDVWQDNEIIAGQDWNPEITNALTSADIVLFLLSIDLLNSTYVWDTELKVTLERRKKKECILVPILIRDCPWNDSPFAEIQMLPRNMVSVNESASKDKAYTEIVTELMRVIKSFNE